MIKKDKREDACELLKWAESSFKINSYDLATCLMELVPWYKKLDKNDEASILLDEAAEYFRTLKFNKGKLWSGFTLMNLADEFKEIGKFEEACELYKKWEVDCYHSVLEMERLARAYIEMKKPAEAIRFLKETESHLRSFLNGSLHDLSFNIINLAELFDLYAECGAGEEVERLSQEAASCKKIDEEARELKAKADELKETGDLDKAFECYKKCEIYLEENNVYWLKWHFFWEILEAYEEMRKAGYDSDSD